MSYYPSIGEVAVLVFGFVLVFVLVPKLMSLPIVGGWRQK